MPPSAALNAASAARPKAGAAPLLELHDVRKSFGAQAVLKGVSLTVRQGEFLTFLGPSGCGKTTTLRVIAGFESPDSGAVKLAGRDVTALPPYSRDVHTVFQHYALFPHYDVFDNIAFGLRLKKVPEEEVKRRVQESLSLVKLSGFEKRRTGQLSGGQMQRIALARALVGRPSLLLLDEPLGALDLKLRKEMQLELKSLQRRLGIAFVYVTHDQEEAMTMSDRIAVFNLGLIEQLGAPEAIYERPRTAFVADFLGAANILSAKVLASSAGRLRLKLEDEVDLEIDGAAPRSRDSIKLALRPERVSVRYDDAGDTPEGVIRLKATVVDNVFLGGASQFYLLPFRSPGKVLLAVSMDPAHRRQKLDSGAQVWAEFSAADLLPLDD